tara:strand:+ start:86 stop:1063 length:978 start_codon:yes stop_codon:yes gene_type:complete
MNTSHYTRKLRQGSTAVWWWRAPLAVDTTAVTATFRLTAGNFPLVLAPVTADLVVSAIAADRRTLTITVPPAAPSGPQGIRGEAYLETPADGDFSVQVAQLTATTAVLAEPLPHDIDLTTNGSLRFAWLGGAVTNADVTAAVERNIPTDITYQLRYGADVAGIPSRDEVMVHVVRQPFRTGVTHADVSALMPSVGARVASRAQDYRPQIEWVGDLIETRVRSVLAARGDAFEDDVDGSRLRGAHAAWTISCILEDIDTDLADRWRKRADEAFDEAMQSIWIDLDRDGVVDDGEVVIVGDPLGDAGGTFAAAPDPNRIIGRTDIGH